ncbi:MAG: BrnT family toxin [Pseudomonadota bacterium]
MLIIWDEAKRAANLAKHGMDFADLDYDFFLSSSVVPARTPRRKALGALAGKSVVVIFQLYGSEAISVISMRPAARGERP